jgi:hypothetical protein
VDQPYCRSAEECVEEMLRDYRRELEAFGVEWVKKWLDLRERLIEIAKVMRRYPWMVDVVKHGAGVQQIRGI